MRRSGALLLVLLACEGPPADELQQQPVVTAVRPNVVVLMADDLDVPSLNKLLELGLLPNLKRYVIDRGTTFRQAFATHPLCAPSRATFLTGQYGHNHGVRTNALPSGGVTKMDDRSTIATWLRAAGYRTGFAGKYLNGYGTDTPATYVPPGWDDWQGLVDPTTYNVYDYKLNDNGTVVSYGHAAADYQTDVLARRTAAFIDESEANDDRPFFMYVTPLAPHVELVSMAATSLDGMQYPDLWRWWIRPPERYRMVTSIGVLPLIALGKPSFNEGDMSDKPMYARLYRPALTGDDVRAATVQYRSRQASMLAVDDMVGTIASALARNGELDRTVFIFTGDNGFMFGEHRMGEKLPIYEESVRIPLVISVPGQTTARVVDQLALNNDLAPTIAALAGVTPATPPDGRSLVPLLWDGGSYVPRRQFLLEHWVQAGVTGSALIMEVPTYTAVRTTQAIYAEYYDASRAITDRELYDLKADPYQLASAHATRPILRATLDGLRKPLVACRAGTCATAENR